MKIELSGEQKKVLTLPDTGPILIKGGAGSGKTLVSVQRAEQLYLIQQLDMFIQTNICIFTYNGALTYEIVRLLNNHQIVVQKIDKWVYHFLERNGMRLSMLSDRKLRDLRMDALRKTRTAASDAERNSAIARKPDSFYEAEFRWIKGRRIYTLGQYLETKRTGRGKEDRVTASDRAFIWSVFEAYQENLREEELMDWDDRVERALTIIESDPNFLPPFSHIVVDEAQDFSFAKLQLIRRLVSKETQSVTIVADSAQQIYQSGFSWSDVGFNVRGRSIEFHHNYRNTRQIADFANDFLSHSADQSDYTPMVSSSRDGNKPLILSGSEENELAYTLRQIREISQEEDVVIGFRNRENLFPIRKRLEENGYEVVDVTRINPRIFRRGAAREIWISTFHSLKGLQFSHVFLFGVNRGNLLPMSNPSEEEVEKARKLVYVAITRAKKNLTMFTEGEEEIFLDEVNPDLYVRDVCKSMEDAE